MYTYICKNCGKEFKNANKNRKYCSNECKMSVLKSNLSQNKKDLTGQRFGRLVAITSKNINKRYQWFCKCDCGSEIWVQGAFLTNGHTQSCGCINKDYLKTNNKKILKNYKEKNYVEGTSISSLSSVKSSNNRSGRRGVYWNARTRKWVAKLVFKSHIYRKEFEEKSKAVSYREKLEEQYFKPILDKYNVK